MVKPFPLLVCLVAITSAGAVHAQTPTAEIAGPAHYPAGAAPGVHHLGQSGVPMIGPVVDPAQSRASVVGPAAYASAPRGDGLARTALDHRFAPDGLYGSVGFVCDNDNHPPAPHEVGVLAGSQDGRLMGGTLRLPF